MRIESGHFGVTPLGHPVTRFTLFNDHGIQVSLINLGATVQSLLAPDRNGKIDDIVLGYDTVEGYWRDIHYMGAVIGRYANRIAGGRFTLDGVTYDLAQNHHGHHLHGGAMGFDKRLWHAAVEERRECAILRFERISEHGEENYPGNLSVTVDYSLNNDNELGIRYRAETDRPTPVNLTHHGYFNLSGHDDSTIDHHVLWINADHFIPVDSESIPFGKISPVFDTPFDFRKPTAIGKRINGSDPQLRNVGGYDHTWVLKDHDGKLNLQSSVYHGDSGRLLEVLTSEPGLQFYSGNSLHNHGRGKNGRQFRRRQGLCLETQHFPNSPNQPEFPSTILHPGQIYQSETVYRFTQQGI